MDPRVIEACQFITGNLAGELRIEDVARHVCLSPSRLAHRFREQVGINILRWREDQRVIRAKLLLQTTQESIANIGRVVGYDDQLYFPEYSENAWASVPVIFGGAVVKSTTRPPKRARRRAGEIKALAWLASERDER
ncbi:helix-turn-helix protein [Brenneria salicis ATCC 15712 = DSM 30166]|uniref:Helix-turn-helix protein n=1 Tax=Brenneria salicis ATCC 15712 = DSM 30166 TaxID=714314 RepID=A0A366I2H6_9GAMM|nr:helix-turn-helix protein [Brenneria salicis ATCC 15712 = DSM 30166]